MVGGLAGAWQSLEYNMEKFVGETEEVLNVHTWVLICKHKE